VLLETDSPYLVPSGVKARRNSPLMIPLIAERLAGVINRTVAEIAAITTRNAERVFGLKASVASS
jgi:TatD DNase family protein